jgi:hypothetical protein
MSLLLKKNPFSLFSKIGAMHATQSDVRSGFSTTHSEARKKNKMSDPVRSGIERSTALRSQSRSKTCAERSDCGVVDTTSIN